ncbi:class I SAM-dependent methyltransferase [Mucilaginibacter sp. RS28]|uniref:Class I SAM-dependent methyltransferase n=1 Tax=Mucilaginibacter straminoryzae TaxID=2932774 RepID=A0A9X2B9K4_9SPHI|nr:class I SAM-dependent methyltransferase [Mucilaginibacter straminoryzae]MCJ8210719.1 class I SAM-dependent methyltransferase [Mucilaginibacter straminoryzae]
MNTELTDKSFWANYWESKKGLAFKVPVNHTFYKVIRRITGKNKIESAIELGGFPGYYAIFLKNYFGVNASLFDYYIHPQILHEVLAANQLSENDIPAIEGDIFSYSPKKQYDLVLSCGLIEHFTDTRDIISRHVDFVKPGGSLLITLPNFTGVNGWMQRKFDPENYSKHNIDCMDPKLLADHAKALGLKNVRSCYYGKFTIWLENKAQQPSSVKALFKLIWLTGKIFTKIIPIDSKQLSPYIVLTATK